MPKYKANRRTWLSHEARMVEAGEVFVTEFPKVPKMREGAGQVVVGADGRLVTAPSEPELDKDGKPVMTDMRLDENIELVGGGADVSEPAIGTERGDKKIDREGIDKAMQDHVDRQRASLPSPGLPRLEGAEPQRAMDGPPTRDTDDDQDGGNKTPAERRAADQRKAK